MLFALFLVAFCICGVSPESNWLSPGYEPGVVYISIPPDRYVFVDPENFEISAPELRVRYSASELRIKLFTFSFNKDK